MNEWQPIETAPRDGTSILLYLPNNDRRTVREAWWSIPYEGAPTGYWTTPHGPTGRGYIILQDAPSHWMPLPAPPGSSNRLIPTVDQTWEAKAVALRMALQMLYDDTADYIERNKLGGMDNHCMRLAREALALMPRQDEP